MVRFQYREKQYPARRSILSLCVFILIMLLFYRGIHSLSSGNSRRQKENLENALNRNITYCYAVEGTYPESLAYLKDHYGLTYDEELFYIDYRVNGANILPDVTIIERGD